MAKRYSERQWCEMRADEYAEESGSMVSRGRKRAQTRPKPEWQAKRFGATSRNAGELATCRSNCNTPRRLLSLDKSDLHRLISAACRQKALSEASSNQFCAQNNAGQHTRRRTGVRIEDIISLPPNTIELTHGYAEEVTFVSVHVQLACAPKSRRVR